MKFEIRFHWFRILLYLSVNRNVKLACSITRDENNLKFNIGVQGTTQTLKKVPALIQSCDTWSTMYRHLYIRDYYRGVYILQSDKRLCVEGLELKLRWQYEAYRLSSTWYKHILVKLAIKTPHQDDSPLLKLFQYPMKSYRNTKFFLNILEIQNNRAEIWNLSQKSWKFEISLKIGWISKSRRRNRRVKDPSIFIYNFVYYAV